MIKCYTVECRKKVFLFLLFSVLFHCFSYAQDRVVSGKVLEAGTKIPVIGAAIKIKGTTRGVSSDVNGSFKIKAKDGDVLEVSSVGYKSITVPVDFSKDLVISLFEDNKALSEVVVVGYGTQKRATLTGAVATISSKSFEDRGPTNNPLANIQGQAPGVVVTRTSAQPGRENWNFQVRGVSSVNNQDPLVMVDGVALVSNNALNSINPADIDNISILKDASAAIYGARAAYGVVLITTKRAKGGAFKVEYSPTISRKLIGLQPELINLNQWATGLKQALINDSYGIDPESYLWYQYAQFILKSGLIGSSLAGTDIPGYAGTLTNNPNLRYNGLLVPGFGDVKDLSFFDTNMSKILWGPATSTQHDLSFSGGSEKQAYRVSLGYLDDASQLKYGANGSQRYNIRLNHDYKFSNALKLATSISLERNDVQQPTLYGTGGYSALSTYSQPGIPAFTASGKPYAWGTVYSAPGQLRDGGDNLEYNYRAFINSNLSYNFLKHFTFTGIAGYNLWVQDNRVQTKQVQYYSYNDQVLVATNPLSGIITSGANVGANYYRQDINNPFYNLVAQLSYSNTFAGKHDIGLMVGSAYERNEYNLINTRTYNLASDEIPYLGGGLTSGTAGFVTNGENRYHSALGSYFGRATYAYKGKYLVEAIGRYDGSSKFIADKRWRGFYGAQAGWRLSEEALVKKLNFFDNLKLRASYGTTGNQADIGLYDYLQQLAVASSGNMLGSTIATQAATSGPLVSLDRTWETVRNYNLGVDFGFLKNRLSGTFETFRKRNSNMLVNLAYPGVLGATAPKTNDGELKTWGWEGILTWKDHVGKVKYSISGNITDNQNKLIKVSGAANGITPGYNNLVEGYPLGSYFGLRYGGRLQTQEQVDAYNAAYYNPGGVINNIGLPAATPLQNQPGKFTGLRPGDNSFVDVNGDGALSTGINTANPGDLVFLGTDNPRYTFGFNLGLQWKGFDFYSILQGVGKRTIFRGGNWRVPYLSIFQGQTKSYVGNVWSPENQEAYYPNLHSALNNGINNYNYQASTWSVENGKYLRLKNVVLGYTLPKSLLAKQKAISNLRVYVSGSDLWETTKIHDGWDPEATRNVGGNERYPFYRYVSLGANVTF